MVFSDATLLRNRRAAAAPHRGELLGISGVGPKKLELYGEAMLLAGQLPGAAE